MSERVAERIAPAAATARGLTRARLIAFVLMVAVLLVAPLFVYPLFLMKALCFALFACAFNLLLGYVGLLSFGHALFFGWASYVSAHAAKVVGAFAAGARDPVAGAAPARVLAALRR